MPSGLSDPGSTYWQAFAVSIRVPWFIATFELCDDGLAYLQTVCLWWTTDLFALLEQAPPARLLSLQCVCPQRNADPRWCMRDVARIWRGTEPASMQRELIFEDGEGKYFSAFHADFADEFFVDRELVIELPQQWSASSSADPPNEKNATVP